MRLGLIDEQKIKELDDDNECDLESDEIGKSSYSSLDIHVDHPEL